MSSSNSPYQPPVHITQLSVQQIDICAVPLSQSAPGAKPSYVEPTALYPQNTRPKDKAAYEEQIRKHYNSNLKEYQETSMVKRSGGTIPKKPTVKETEKDFQKPFPNEEETSETGKGSGTIQDSCADGREDEVQSINPKSEKRRSKAHAGFSRFQKKYSEKKKKKMRGLSSHRKRGKQSECKE